MPPDHPFARLAGTLPGLPYAPEPWLLGSSPQSAIWAAELGLPYAFADFINPAGAPIAASYRERFVDSARLASPRVRRSASWTLCAEPREEAEYLAASSRWAMVKLRRGELIAVPPPDEALRNLEAAERSGLRSGHRRRTVLGTPAQVRDELEQIAAEYGAEELVIVTITHDHAVRRRSYELLAAAFELEPREALAAVREG